MPGTFYCAYLDSQLVAFEFWTHHSQVLFLETARFKLSTSLSIAHLEHTNFVVAVCRYEGVGLQTSVIS